MNEGKTFYQRLEAQWAKGKFVCVGLDPVVERLPACTRHGSMAGAITEFNMDIVKATRDLACCYKPNIAFYEAYGEEGRVALMNTIWYIRRDTPEIPIVLDAKRGDIGDTNAAYAKALFDDYGADAVTVNPYLGEEALRPFLERKDKGVIVLCRTSNKGGGEFQDLMVGISDAEGKFLNDRGVPADYKRTAGWSAALYLHVAYQVSQKWNTNGNCALVAGATFPAEIGHIRKTIGDMPLLIPGIGKQGGDREGAVKNGRDSRGWGMMINSSSGIIFASQGEDFAEAARREAQKLHDAINDILKGGIAA